MFEVSAVSALRSFAARIPAGDDVFGVMAVRQALARGLLTCRQLAHEADRQHRRPIIERALAEAER